MKLNGLSVFFLAIVQGCSLLDGREAVIEGGFSPPRFTGKPGSHEFGLAVGYKEFLPGTSTDLVLIPTVARELLEHRLSIYRMNADTGAVVKIGTLPFPRHVRDGRAFIREEWDGDDFFVQLRHSGTWETLVLRVGGDGSISEVQGVPEHAISSRPYPRRSKRMVTVWGKGRTLLIATEDQPEWEPRFCLLAESFEPIAWTDTRFADCLQAPLP